jgi:hypothetical protein
MTITLKLSSEQEHLLRAGVAEKDAQTVREVLLQAVDSTIEGLLRTSVPPLKATELPALLDKIAAGFRDAPTLSDEAVSRAGIYDDHPTSSQEDREQAVRELLELSRKATSGSEGRRWSREVLHELDALGETEHPSVLPSREPFAALRALSGTAHSDVTDISTDKYAHAAESGDLDEATDRSRTQ